MLRLTAVAILGALTLPVCAQVAPVRLEHHSLTRKGSRPFEVQASLSSNFGTGTLELKWMDATHYRRKLEFPGFSQTLTVDGDKVSEQDSDSYFPPEYDTLLAAAFAPESLAKQAYQPERAITKANGRASENGMQCFDPARKMCFADPGSGLSESLHTVTGVVSFKDFNSFRNVRIARTIRLRENAGAGRDFTLHLEKLSAWTPKPDETISVEAPTPAEDRILRVPLSSSEIVSAASGDHEIIWPQPLDGGEHGKAVFYISVDRDGKVRSVVPLETVNERTNESAVNQLMRWQFKRVQSQGLPVQFDGLVQLDVDTRKYGPKEPLTDAEARKLATNIVEPENMQAAGYPSGTEYALPISVDADGHLIEIIQVDPHHNLGDACFNAVRKWTFHPVIQDGQPRPYRAVVVFRVP